MVDPCPFHVESLSLREAQARCQREARHAVCDTGRYRCPYVDWGHGPALVFIPGLIDPAAAFLLPMAHLSRHFRCIAYDWPTGLGDGAHWPTYRHADLVDDFIALVDHAGADGAVPIGYSLGSTVALRALHRWPERFRRGVLLSGFARRRLAPAEVLLASLGRWWPGPMKRLPLRQAVLRATQAWCFQHCEPDVWDYYLGLTGLMPMAGVAYRALLLHQVDLRPLLTALRQPLLMICGDTDSLVRKPCETELLTGLSNVTRAELTHCGHHALYTHAETMAEVIGGFVLDGR